MNILKLRIFSFFLASIALIACQEDTIDQMDVNKDSTSAEFTIEKGTPVGAINETVAITYDLNQIAADNGVDASKLKTLKLKSLSMASSNGVSFDALDKVTISISADGLAKKTIVTKDPVDANGATVINFDVDPNMDLMPYFKGTNMLVEVSGQTNQSLNEDLKARVDVNYDILIDI